MKIINLRLSAVDDEIDKTDFNYTDISDRYKEDQERERKEVRYPFHNHPSEKGNEIGIEGGLPYGLANNLQDREFTFPEVQTPRKRTLPYFDGSEEIEIKEKEPETRKYPGRDIFKRSPWGDFTEQNLNTNGGKMETLSLRNEALDDNHADLDKTPVLVELETLDDEEVKDIFNDLGSDYLNLEIDLTASKLGDILPDTWKTDISSIKVVGRSLARRLKISREAGERLVKKCLQETPSYPLPAVAPAPGMSWVWNPDQGEWQQKPNQEQTGAVPQY